MARLACALLCLCVWSALAEEVAPRRIDDVLQALQQYKPDREIGRRARDAVDRPPPATQNAAELFAFYHQRGRIAARIGRMTQQISDFREALKHLAAVDSHAQRVLLSDLARSEMAGGNLLEAYKLRESQIDHTGRRADTQLEPLMWMVQINAQLGDFAAARDALAKAETVAGVATTQRSGRRGRRPSERVGLHKNQWTAQIEAARGALAQAEGRQFEAQEAFRNAVTAVEDDREDARKRAQAQGQSGSNLTRYEALREELLRAHAASLMRLQRFGEAEFVNRMAFKSAIARTGRFSVDTAAVLEQLAEIVFQQGRYGEAETLAREAINMLEQAGATPESLYLVQARKSVGRLLAVQGKWQDADAEFTRMEEGLRNDPLLMQKLGSGDLAWSLVLARLNRADRAIAMLEPMLAQTGSRFGPASFQSAEVRGFLGIARAARGDHAGALGEFRQAVPVLVEHVNDQAGAAGGAARTWRLVQVLECYIELLVAEASRGGAAAADALAESFRLADTARGGRVQRALASSAARATIGDPQLSELARTEQDAGQRIGALNDLISNMLAAPPSQQVPAVLTELRKEIAELTAERRRTQTQIEKRFPDYANLVDPKPPSLAQTRASLREGEALLAVYVGRERSFAWAVPKSASPAVAVVTLGEDEIMRRVAHLRKALDANATTIDDIPRFDVAAAYELYAVLLKPIEAGFLQSTSVFVVPHHALGQLPFALLPTEAPGEARTAGIQFEAYRAVSWLARRVAITQLPSVNTLITFRATPPATATRRAYAGFGDPLFARSDATVAVSTLATRGAAVNLRKAAVPPGASSVDVSQLPRLPDTRDEVLEVSKVMNADPGQDVFLGERASMKAIRNGSLTNRRVIHFATHGLVPGELDGLTQPALALSSPQAVGADAGDGLLKLDDILALKLNADWVVLSACNTASADGSGNAEAVSGLGRAFFFAGARALLVSNWPVDSASARKLMTDVFRGQAADPKLDRSQALRQAMLGMIDSGVAPDAAGKPLYSYAHPLFWAPFSLVGDSGGR